MPPADTRCNIWKSLIPPAAPIAADVDFNVLGRKFELFPGSIQAAISHAAAEASSRPSPQKITYKDLLSAGEYEIAKVNCWCTPKYFFLYFFANVVSFLYNTVTIVQKRQSRHDFKVVFLNFIVVVFFLCFFEGRYVSL